ncbi:hypothetical protein CLF_101640 [Clonorchis sinensis]|uniref:Uncharacterized protein n=1 Tax=Clonorchis sinensis TaxID=79923 RepID=G7Y675_CLOSI|nr:hypothetical protein CLF_101640 [Clonorchis sinensis]
MPIEFDVHNTELHVISNAKKSTAPNHTGPHKPLLTRNLSRFIPELKTVLDENVCPVEQLENIALMTIPATVIRRIYYSTSEASVIMDIPEFVARKMLLSKLPRGCQPTSYNLLDAAFLRFSSKSSSAIASTALQNENNGNELEYDHLPRKAEGAVKKEESANEGKEDEDELDKSVRNPEPQTWIRNFRRADFSGMRIFLNQVKLGTASVEDLYRTIVQKVHETDAMFVPKKPARSRMSRKLPKRIRRLLEKRSQLFFKKLTTGDIEDELTFRKMRNRCKSEIRQWNIRKQATILDLARKNRNVLFKYMRHRRRNKPSAFSLRDRNGELTSDPTVVSEFYRDHYAGERQLLNDKNKTDPGNLGKSLAPVYQSVNP